MPDFTWNHENNELIFSILAVTMGFNLYWFISKSEKLKQRRLDKLGAESASIRTILVEKTNGLVYMGILPAVVAFFLFGKTPIDYGLHFNFGNGWESLYWIAGLAPLIWTVNFFAARSPKTQAHYPQIRKQEWSPALLAKHLAGWAMYLFGYEFLFRGILLFGSLSVLDPWVAILLNVGFYSVSHVPKGATETFGAIPLGFLLSWITLRTGTIWVAFLVHVCLAWSNAVFTLKHHPEMHLVRTTRKS